MEHVMKLMNVSRMIKICLWGVFIATLLFTVLNGISVLGFMATVGMLLMAIDYPKKS